MCAYTKSPSPSVLALSAFSALSVAAYIPLVYAVVPPPPRVMAVRCCFCERNAHTKIYGVKKRANF